MNQLAIFECGNGALPAGQFRFCNISKVAQTARLGTSSS